MLAKIEQFLARTSYVADEVHRSPRLLRAGRRDHPKPSPASGDGVYDDVPEQAFSGIGGIDDLEEKWHNMQKELGA